MQNNDFENKLNDLQKQLNALKTKNNSGELTAQQKADRKYKAKLESVNLRFRPQDMSLLEHLKQQSNMNLYLKTLIAKDMGYKSWEHYTGMFPSEDFRDEWEKDRKRQLVRSNLLKLSTWQELNDYIENNDISELEWQEIEYLFYIEENPTGIGYDMFTVGALPFKAWTKNTIKSKVNKNFEYAPFEKNIDWSKYSEKVLQKKLLKKSPFGNKDSKLNKHIVFYKIDDDAAIKYFKIDYNPGPTLFVRNNDVDI